MKYDYSRPIFYGLHACQQINWCAVLAGIRIRSRSDHTGCKGTENLYYLLQLYTNTNQWRS